MHGRSRWVALRFRSSGRFLKANRPLFWLIVYGRHIRFSRVIFFILDIARIERPEPAGQVCGDGVGWGRKSGSKTEAPLSPGLASGIEHSAYEEQP
jgi:hypothetical protein